MLDQTSDFDRVRAWAVHIFTASGALAGLMSLVHIFQGEVDRPDIPADFDRAEVSALRWVSIDELRREVARQPDDFTPWLRIYLERWGELALRPAA
jgi:hypothetical protein